MGVETTFDVIKEGEQFPSIDALNRNARYRLNEKRFNGSYSDNKKVIVKDKNGVEHVANWKLLKLNKFKLYTNKMDGIIFNNDPVIKTGDYERDRVVNKLVERTGWLRGIRQAVRYLEIYGDVYIKTYRKGISAIRPYNAFKVVDEKDVNNVLGYVLVDLITNDNNIVEAVRFETHFDGGAYERVYKYDGVRLGKPIRYKYRDRIIPVAGLSYVTGIDKCMVQHICVDSVDGVYGQSPYEDFAELVHEAERRQTLSIKVLDAHTEPTVAVATGTLRENEVTGKVENDVLGGIVEVPNGAMLPTYITWDGKLDSNDKMLDTLFSEIYEITELGRTFMTGEYQGNISEESLNTLVKSALDKANRHVFDIWYEVVKSLYVLCRLNDIDISIDDISIGFNIGTNNNDKTVAEIINSRVSTGTISLESALVKYDGLTNEQAIIEIEKINKERSIKDD